MHTDPENRKDEELTVMKLVIPLIFLSIAALAESPASKILYVAAIAISPCQDAKVLAEWYSRFGIENKEFKGGYYSQIDTAAGPTFFAIHPKTANAPKKCSASISVVFRVENLRRHLLSLKNRGLLPDSTEEDPNE